MMIRKRPAPFPRQKARKKGIFARRRIVGAPWSAVSSPWFCALMFSGGAENDDARRMVISLRACGDLLTVDPVRNIAILLGLEKYGYFASKMDVQFSPGLFMHRFLGICMVVVRASVLLLRICDSGFWFLPMGNGVASRGNFLKQVKNANNLSCT
ncbi:MAG: hypothetical protein ACI4Q7_02445 [Candidatus Avelusimicrobium sp.]